MAGTNRSLNFRTTLAIIIGGVSYNLYWHTGLLLWQAQVCQVETIKKPPLK